MKSFRRKTLTYQTVFEGCGLHSGEPVKVVVKPGDSGITFNGVQAVPASVTDTSRCTKLGDVSTIEHLMSALAALGITDSEIEVDAGEMPAMDGASEMYFLQLSKVVTTDLGEQSIDGKIAIEHIDDDISVTVNSGTGVWRYEFECGDRWPHSLHFEVALSEQTYSTEIAPARTFAFESEIEMVRAAGLGQGLDETTAFLIGSEGYVNEAKFEDEPARHKMLDLIGDLYLSGVPIEMLDVVASRSGHKANVAVAQKLRDAVVFSD